MKDITPEHLRCIPGSCPAIYEVTPSHLKCVGNMPVCPGIHAIEGSDDIIVVGKRLDPRMWNEIEAKVGPDEFAVRINKAFFAELK